MKKEILTEKDIVIIVPLHLRETLTHAEQISLKHLRTYLNRYDKYFIASRKLKLDQIDKSGFEVMKFPNKYFGSVRAHNKLMINTKIYKAFSNYKFILVYHLDSLVFSDRLLEWCERGYDFIAPPWLAQEYPIKKKAAVGNGGFSIRNVRSFIKLYSSGRYWLEPEEIAAEIESRIPVLKKPFYYLSKQVFKIKLINNIRIHYFYFNYVKRRNEDRFISSFSNHYYPDFKIPSVEEALEFAFEASPRKCYEMNNNRMPFGCHAFERYDFEFWEPYLIKT